MTAPATVPARAPVPSLGVVLVGCPDCHTVIGVDGAPGLAGALAAHRSACLAADDVCGACGCEAELSPRGDGWRCGDCLGERLVDTLTSPTRAGPPTSGPCCPGPAAARPAPDRRRARREGGRMMPAALTLPGLAVPVWQVRGRSDPAARALADRHYSRKRPGAPWIGPPGRLLDQLDHRQPQPPTWPYLEGTKP